MNIPTIILTSTVNCKNCIIHLIQKDPEERKKSYLKSVRQWLNKTNLNIILVENSGYTFEELNLEKEKFKHRFQVITFDESKEETAKYLENIPSKGASEIYQINYAFYNSKLILETNTNFVIKITARFFIPELENYLKKINLNSFQALCQNNRKRCEMVGSHIYSFRYIFHTQLINKKGNYDYHVENIYKERINNCKNVIRCKEFNINPTQRGGSNIKYTTI
jgi:hypothetical protein